MAEPIQIGINIDGVLHHDGLPPVDTATRFQMVAEAGVFDYVEKNRMPHEDLVPWAPLVERHGLPIRVVGGIFCAGRDEADAKLTFDWGARFGSKVFNCQLYANHADGHRLSDQEVADFYLQLCEWGEPIGCLPSLEVHVDMWSEDFSRIERVATLVQQAGGALRLTLDHSHLLFKIGNPAELDVSGIRKQVEAGRLVLDPASPGAVYTQWIEQGWVHHAHARSVVPNNPVNAWMQRADGRPGRGIQYPFLRPEAGAYHATWQADALSTWKEAVRQLLAWQVSELAPRLRQISCEFIPFPDYGGGARYSIFDHNVACARWLRQTWLELMEQRYGRVEAVN